MKITLTGKKAVVSGSTAGMGYAIAQGLAEAGASVVINGRNEERLHDARQRLLYHVPGAEVTAIAADVGDVAALNQLIAAVPQADILVNEEIANFVVFLASDQASAITGVALRVDGGIVRSLLG